MTDLICETCGKTFQRNSSEARRNAARGMRTFCSLKCRGKKIYADTPVEKRVGSKYLPVNKPDELSPFRPHIKSIRCHAKKIGKQVLIEAADLKRQWEKQDGRCPFTNWEMINFKSTRDAPPRRPERASLDRIDPHGDYTKENVRFICMMAQFAKNNFSDEDLMRFCKTVAKESE